jgi:hypothetical protein
MIVDEIYVHAVFSINTHDQEEIAHGVYETNLPSYYHSPGNKTQNPQTYKSGGDYETESHFLLFQKSSRYAKIRVEYYMSRTNEQTD